VSVMKGPFEEGGLRVVCSRQSGNSDRYYWAASLRFSATKKWRFGVGLRMQRRWCSGMKVGIGRAETIPGDTPIYLVTGDPPQESVRVNFRNEPI